MNPPQVYMCSPSWTLLPPSSPYHRSGLSQCTSPKHPVSCIKPGLATRFIHDIILVSMPFSPIFPPSPSPTESIRLFYTSVSLLLSRIQGYCYHLCKFHIYVLVYCIRKHHYEQSYWRWWNSSWAISNPERWCCENAALNMQANLENSAVATGLEKVSFHSNPK